MDSSLVGTRRDRATGTGKNLANAVGDYTARALSQVGVSDYFLALSVRGERSYYTSGRACDESEAMASPRSSFELSCLFKPLIAAVSLELSQRGVLRLDAPLGDYLPELAADEKGRLVRVRDLISHTAGYQGFNFFPPFGVLPDKAIAYAKVRKASQFFWPGLVFNYEHSVLALLGEILCRVSAPPGDLVEKMIFEPLRLHTRSTDGVSYRSAAQSAANAGARPAATSSPSAPALSIADLLTIVESLMGTRPASPLTPLTVRAMQDQVVRIPRTAGTSAVKLLPIGYGLGLEVFRNGFSGYDGRAASQVLGFRFHRDSEVALALGINQGGPVFRRVVLGGILDLFPDSPGPEDVDSPAGNLGLDEILGQYVGNDCSIVTVRSKGDEVRIIVEERPRVATQIQGHRESDGHLVFDVKHPGGDPTFFRYSRTDEPCLMLGMCAFKKVPLLVGG